MSGHNKWSKIKHKKAATDAQKSKIFSKHAMLITMETKKANGDKNASNVISAIERAKKDSMPRENIERALSKGCNIDSNNMEEVLFEGYGPGGVALLIEAVTDNNNRTAPEIRNIFSKAGLEIGVPGSALWAFTKTNSGYIPNHPIEINDEIDEKLNDLVEKLNEHSDVMNVYTTADNLE